MLPGQNRSVIVSETVSLRDLPATIVDLTGQGTRAPFPGRSLARLWRDSRPADPSSDAGKERSRNWRVPIRMIRIKGGRPFIGAHWSHSPKAITSTFAMKVTAARSFSTSAMIPNEFDNRARFEAAQAVKERLRAHLNQMRAGHRGAAE